MGQARHNGTYEERKAAAIAAGRVKAVEAPRHYVPMRVSGAQLLASILALSGPVGALRGVTRKREGKELNS